MASTEPTRTEHHPATPGPKEAPGSLGDRAVTLALRGALGLAGVGLFVGFFMPWLRLGEMATLSGFSMLVTGGQAISALSGPHRALLFVVPLGGALLCLAAWRGGRLLAWVSLLIGAIVCAAGVITPLLVFFDTIGSGVWVAALSALVTLGIGIYWVSHPPSPPPKAGGSV